MALYDGFFDAELDEETEEYDRAYGSGDFTEYFSQIVGSGVCIHGNPDSFQARWEDGAVVLSPGYLFIQGHWLKNDSDLTVAISGSAPAAVVAHLNKGKKMIEVEARSVSASYPDALVLALVDPAAGTVADTRYDTGICGVIDSAGGLSSKAEYAASYIDNDIADKLAQIEAGIRAQETALDEKIAEVGAVVEQIAPPPIGSIKFSAAQDMGENWLKCDGRFVSGEEYPELVEALRGIPSKSFPIEILHTYPHLLMGNVSNGVIWDGYFWFIGINNWKLYGIQLESGDLKEITITSIGTATKPENSSAISGAITGNLSIVTIDGENTLYLLPKSGAYSTEYINNSLTYSPKYEYFYFAGFTSTLSEIALQIGSASSENPTVSGKILKIANSSNNPYDNSFGYRPIYVFDSVPCVALEIQTWTEISVPYSGYISESCYWGQYLIWAMLNNSGGGDLVFRTIKTGSIKKSQQMTNYWKDQLNNYKSSICGTPGMDGQGGIYYPAETPIKLYSVKGNTQAEIGRVSSWEPMWSQSTNLPTVQGGDYVVFPYTNGIAYNVLYGVKLSNMAQFACSINGFVNAFRDYSSIVFYLEDKDLWVIVTTSNIIFTKDPSDVNQFTYFDITGVFGEITDTPIRPLICYDGGSKFYFLLGSATYDIRLGVIDIPEDFDPVNGAYLPKMSMDNIPAYIKSYELEETS